MNTMKYSRNIIRWFYPLALGVVIFNVIRLVTDLTLRNGFWTGDKQQHIISLLFIVVFCYMYDFAWIHRLRKRRIGESAIKEYITLSVRLFIQLNSLIAIGEFVGLLHLGNGIVDYIIANVVCIPFLLIYYTLLRNEIINKHLNEQILQFEQLKSKQLETELDYLKAQYHPHFLFNALNTVYFQVDESNSEAKETIEILSDLLRYQLYTINKVVSIEEEIEFIRQYIRFQQLRVSKRLVLHTQIDTVTTNQPIHPLLFQPLLENAFKYVDGDFTIDIRIGISGNNIQFEVINSLSESNEIEPRKEKGIGIENLKRRLALLYPNKHRLVTETRESQFYAGLTIEL